MKPGRELDVLVAERVMGFEVRNSQYGAPSVLRLQDGGVYRTRDGRPADMIGGVREYSTDIAAAWEVVEKVWGKMPVTQHSFRIEWDESMWRVGGGYHDYETGYEWVDDVEAKTAPLAICLAALKAVER